VSDPTPAEILRRARPIPTYRDHPATSPVDVAGVGPDGRPIRVAIVGSDEPVLLLFLSAACDGCRDLWEGTAELGRALPDGVRVVIVTKGADHEKAEEIAALAPAGLTTVMSGPAWRDYRVAGPPFLVVTKGGHVVTEGVAWGVEETARATRQAVAVNGSGNTHSG
jgi:hypothetical protein